MNYGLYQRKPKRRTLIPHISKVEINGEIIPSVNTITDSLSKDGLDQWKRRVGFKAADKVSKESRERGNRIGKIFEDILKGNSYTVLPDDKKFETEFLKWAKQIKSVDPKHVEPHLINPVDMYHGSPDVVPDFGDGLVMVDYKVKERGYDYKILMNEAAYCEAWRVQHGDEIKFIRLVNFHPVSAKVHDSGPIPLNHKWLQDFFTCHEMWKVNQTAQAYWQKNCKNKLEA